MVALPMFDADQDGEEGPLLAVRTGCSHGGKMDESTV